MEFREKRTMDDAFLPHPPSITVDVVRRLLAELSPGWHLIVDEPSRIIFLDEGGEARGYLDVAQARIVLIDGDTRNL